MHLFLLSWGPYNHGSIAALWFFLQLPRCMTQPGSKNIILELFDLLDPGCHITGVHNSRDPKDPK